MRKQWKQKQACQCQGTEGQRHQQQPWHISVESQMRRIHISLELMYCSQEAERVTQKEKEQSWDSSDSTCWSRSRKLTIRRHLEASLRIDIRLRHPVWKPIPFLFLLFLATSIYIEVAISEKVALQLTGPPFSLLNMNRYPRINGTTVSCGSKQRALGVTENVKELHTERNTKDKRKHCW